MKQLILIITLILFSCNSNDNETVRNVNFSLIEQGQLYGNGAENIEKSNLIIQDISSWNDLIDKMNTVNNVSDNFTETDIDFSQYLIIAVFDEIYNNGGHSIDIVSILENENNISVKIDNLMTGDASSVITQPFHIGLSRRLQERLGYLGVFYKRDPARFLGSLPPDERKELLESLQRTYRDLLISYFSDPASANQALESFVNTAFFIDLPITRTVEIHVDLIDEFWKQLRLEGHKNDFLQDYRLALLDVMAHLCEMYRRSIPPDIPLSGSGSPRLRREPDLPEAPEVST